MSLTFPFYSRLARNLARANTRQDWRNLPAPRPEEIVTEHPVATPAAPKKAWVDDYELVLPPRFMTERPVRTRLLVEHLPVNYEPVRRTREWQHDFDNSRHFRGHRSRHSDRFEIELAEFDAQQELAMNDEDPEILPYCDYMEFDVDGLPSWIEQDPEIAEFVRELERQAA